MDDSSLAEIVSALLKNRQLGVPMEAPQPSTLADLLARYQNGQQNQQQYPAPYPLRLEGSLGMGNGILSGGGRATYDVPNSLGALLQIYAGGGGAIGSINTPEGRQKIREFSPEFGLQFRKPF